MAQRYLFAVPVPSVIVPSLVAAVEGVTNQPFTVRFPHMSIIHPCTLKDGVTVEQVLAALQQLPIPPLSLSLTTMGVFHPQGRHLVYVHVEPGAALLALHQRLKVLVENLIEVDASIFTDGVVPQFESHVTLAYDLDPTRAANLENKPLSSVPISFSLQKIGLYIEKSKGVWEEVAVSQNMGV